MTTGVVRPPVSNSPTISKPTRRVSIAKWSEEFFLLLAPPRLPVEYHNDLYFLRKYCRTLYRIDPDMPVLTSPVLDADNINESFRMLHRIAAEAYAEGTRVENREILLAAKGIHATTKRLRIALSVNGLPELDTLNVKGGSRE